MPKWLLFMLIAMSLLFLGLFVYSSVYAVKIQGYKDTVYMHIVHNLCKSICFKNLCFELINQSLYNVLFRILWTDVSNVSMAGLVMIECEWVGKIWFCIDQRSLFFPDVNLFLTDSIANTDQKQNTPSKWCSHTKFELFWVIKECIQWVWLRLI